MLDLVKSGFEVLKTLKAPISWIMGLLQRAAGGLERARFHLRDLVEPMPRDRALAISYSVLAGSISEAVAFRNFRVDRLYVAAVRADSDLDNFAKVYILEQIGRTFRVIWISDNYSQRPHSLAARDLNFDGTKEICFIVDSYGSGGGSTTLYVFSISDQNLITLTETHMFSSAGPVSPTISLSGDISVEFRRNIERYALSNGMLKEYTVDLNNPRNMVRLWHKINGSQPLGNIKVLFYPGKPTQDSFVIEPFDDGRIVWYSIFKGPLVGYVKDRDAHFVAYSPLSSYGWVEVLTGDGSALWFACHIEKGVYSFQLAGDNGDLAYYEKFNGGELPIVKRLSYDNDMLVINGSLAIPVAELTKQYFRSARRATP